MGVLLWRPSSPGGRALRYALFFGAGFLGCVFLLFGLFALWWPPGSRVQVFWSVLGLVALGLVVLQGD